MGLVSDLTDAYAEHVPHLDVALTPEEIVADLWVVSAGVSIPPNVWPRPGGITRAALAEGERAGVPCLRRRRWPVTGKARKS